MNLATFVLYFFEMLTVLSAASLLFLKNIFHAALALLVCLLSVAGVFVLCGAELPAVSQILLYAGGVVVLVIFGIMLTNKGGMKSLAITNTNLLGGLAVGSGMLFLLLYFVNESIFKMEPIKSEVTQYNKIQVLGAELMTDYLLPFEVAGILLLMVLVGAATIAGHKGDVSSKT